MNPSEYGKQLVVNMAAGGTETFTGSVAATLAMRFDDMEGIFKVRDEDTGVVKYYHLADAACGLCLLATLTPSATQIEPDECEDGIPNCEVTAISLTPGTLTLKVGEAGRLVVKTTPPNQNVKWESSEPTKVRVDNGLVTGLAAGSSTITVKDAATGEQEATATVTVEA